MCSNISPIALNAFNITEGSQVMAVASSMGIMALWDIMKLRLKLSIKAGVDFVYDHYALTGKEFAV